MAGSPTTIRRWWPLRFSLRVLLLVFTTIAIGFPVWYRWPYEEEQELFSDHPRTVDSFRRVITWQRQWGGGKLKHGEERYYEDGKLRELTTWRNGERHGPFRQFGSSGRLVGVVNYDPVRKIDTTQWLDGQSEVIGHSIWRYGSPRPRQDIVQNGKTVIIDYDQDGEPTSVTIDGRVFEDRLQRLARLGQLDAIRTERELSVPSTIVFNDHTPLEDALEFYSMAHQVPILVDESVDENLTVEDEIVELPLSSALTIISARHGLAWDCRYGCLWLTTPAGLEAWRDPTGVADLKLPAGSALAAAWNESVRLQPNQKHVAGILGEGAHTLAIDVDTSAVDSLTGNEFQPKIEGLHRYPFRHFLGCILYQTRCRCRLEGETLMILPPEEEK